jgi:SAM-dependent methyltransferase
MSYQDSFYKKKESNYYFRRVKKNDNIQKKLRDSKKEILDQLSENIDLRSKKILEIGCFVGDLIWILKKNFSCMVDGIEPSDLACKFAKKNFLINIENTTFAKSKKFLTTVGNLNSYDLIIIDDVLSWIDRSLILQTIASIDWLLKPNGHIFLRDFCPNNSFAVINRHWRKEKIYNFKQANGHKSYFLNSGKYTIVQSKVYQTKKFNKTKTSKEESNIWNDVILKKINNFTFPITRI